MFEPIKHVVLGVLRVPPEPHAPPGTVASRRVFRAAPNYYRYQLALWGIRQAFAVIGVIVFLAVQEGLYAGLAAKGVSAEVVNLLRIVEFVLLPLLVVQILFSYFIVRLDYEMRWYILTDRSLRIRDGVWRVNEMTLTYRNIQRVTVSQGPLQRLLGIADLEVITAGGGGATAGGHTHGAQGLGRSMHTGVLRGVADVAALRELVMSEMRRARSAGLGDPEDRAVHAVADAVAASRALADAARLLRDAL